MKPKSGTAFSVAIFSVPARIHFFLIVLSHYLVCPILWSHIQEYSALSVGQSASQRLCIDATCIDPRLLAVAHIIYHHMKLNDSIAQPRYMYYVDLARRPSRFPGLRM